MSKSNNDGSGWLGWVGFASIMLLLMGSFSLLAGFVALFKDTVVYGASGVTWVLSYTQWGWIHILAGVLAILAATSLASGHMYGRIIAIMVALLSALVNMAFIPVYPFWSIMVIVIDVMVVYAVAVHAGELKE